MTRLRALACALVGTGLLVTSCSDDKPSTVASSSSAAPLSEAEFVRQADLICNEVSSRIAELEDPDGPGGGAKPKGLGTFIRGWVTQLRTLVPPTAVADDWNKGLDLLVQSAKRLDDAEAGDPTGEGEALFVLQAQAQEHFNATGLPFQACFVDSESAVESDVVSE